MGRKNKVTVLLSDAELHKLEFAASRVGVDLTLYLRASALNAAKDVHLERPTYSREQLMSIHRRASLKGHVWTEEELRKRGLPLYWCEDWVRTRLEQGYTRVQLAVEAGYPERSLTTYLNRVYGLREYQKVKDPTREAIQARVGEGKSRDEVAREFGVSVNTVAGYVRQMPGEVERQFQRVVKQVGEWPSSRARIAEVAFGGDAPAASAWLDKKVKRGWLTRVRKGWYDLGGSAPLEAASAAEAPSPAKETSRY